MTWFWKACWNLVLVAGVGAASGGLLADDLEREISEIDRMRANLETNFQEVDRRCEQLLVQYSAPEEQARIYYIWAHVEGQSGLQHPEKLIDLVSKALARPLEDEKRLQLMMYWGNTLEVMNRGARGEDLKKVRPEIVLPYLKAIDGCVEFVAAANEIELPAIVSDDNGQSPNGGKRFMSENARNYAIAQRRQKIERLEAFQKAFENQTAFLYSRMPFHTSEIEQLAAKYVSDSNAQSRLMARVREEIAKREEKVRGDAMKRNPSSKESASRGIAWGWLIVGNSTAVLALATGAWWIRQSRSRGTRS